jgi:chromosome segregation ATPase
MDVMSEIAEVIKSRKEKIAKILSETAAVEQVYLSDVECNLLNGLTVANDSLVALESSNKALLDALAARDTELARAVHESSQLLMQLKVQMDKLELMEEEQKSFVSREDAWTAWMRAEDVAMKSLQDRLDGLTEALRTKKEELVIITREHGACQLTAAKCAELEASLIETKAVLDAESAEKRRLQGLLKATDDALARTKAELEAKVIVNDGLNADLKLIQQVKVDIEATLDTTKNSLDKTLRELSTTRGRFEEADALAKSLSKRLDENRKENVTLSAHITALETTLKASEGSLSDLKALSNKKITEMSASLAEKSSAYEDASVELGAVKTTLEALTAQLTQLKSDEKIGHEVIRVQKAKLEQTSNEVLVLKIEIEDLNSQLKDSNKVKTGLNSDIYGLNEQLKDRAKELNSLQNEIEQNKFKIETLRRDIATLNADKDKLSQESLSRETARVALEMELNKIRAMYSEIEAELKSTNTFIVLSTF